MEQAEKQIYAEYEAFINDHFEVAKERAALLHTYLERSPLYYQDTIKSKCLSVPKVYTKKTFQTLSDILKTTHTICEKVVKRYIEDADYRTLFPFSKELENLILLPSHYDCLLPFGRYDIFYNEETGDFGFCEFNTDGTSGMDENRVHDMAYMDNAAHQDVLSRHNLKPFELFDSLVSEFIEIYKTYDKAKDMPSVAIVDFFDAGRVLEFKQYARTFQKFGCKAYVCDIRDLTYKNNTLYTDLGYPVDAIYRRAVTSDILNRIDTVGPFLEAYRDGNVFLCGSFATQIIHNKWIYYALYHEKTAAFLTDEENDFVRKHVPRTVLFNDKNLLEAVKANKDHYILKPIDSYAAHGVSAGVEMDDQAWAKFCEECFGDAYICQDYMPQYRTKNMDLFFGGMQWKEYINMTGLYSYNGKLTGFFNRLSDGGIIRTYENERMVPTYLIDE